MIVCRTRLPWLDASDSYGRGLLWPLLPPSTRSRARSRGSGRVGRGAPVPWHTGAMSTNWVSVKVSASTATRVR